MRIESIELSCPTCCFNSLQKVRGDEWKCEFCGTSYNFSELRNALDALVGQQFPEDFIDELLGNARLERNPELGERGWRWIGRHGVLLTLDIGNGWYVIVKGSKE